ncbi:MAG: hypothetical protein AAF394_11515, partial [Planctomycetota bacterium]
MSTQPTEHALQDQLLDLLTGDSSHFRMQALHLLSEAYCDSERVLEQVFLAWEKWEPAEAFTEFPMLSFLPIPAGQIVACCEKAQAMAADRKLTDPSARSAGKLVEQLVRLPAKDLEPHLELLEQVKASSKIFFRVNLDQVRDRLQLSDCSADQCAAVLNNSVAELAEGSQNPQVFSQGLAALEALRTYHPDYIDLNSVLKAPVPMKQADESEGEAKPINPSLRLTLQSLCEKAHAGTEPWVGEFLVSDEEAIFSVAVDALVRSGSRLAAEQLLEKVDVADGDNRKWIARGLQRLQLSGLASGIAACRDQCRDPYVWLMLLIAEVRQFQLDSFDRIAFDLSRLQSPSEALADALAMYLHLHSAAVNFGDMRLVVED